MFFNSRTILSTVASSTVPRICPTQRASSISTVTCPVKALVEATPISGPTWMYDPESVFLGIEAPTTLQMPYTKAPLLRANCMAATVPSRSYFLVTPYTSQRRSRMPQKRLDKVGAFVQQSLDDVDVHLVAVSANCTVAVDIPMTVDEVIHIAVIPLAIQNHILKIEFSRF